MESDPRTVVGARAEHEWAMNALYNAFAQRYPKVGDLWQTLCAEAAGLVNLAQLTADAGLPLQEAFGTAVHLEDSLIESQVFVVTDDDSP